MAIAEITKIMRHSEGQKLLLGALKQNFSSDDNEVDGGFGKFEQALEGLITTDAENKKLVLDQVFREFLTKNLVEQQSSGLDVGVCQKFVAQYAIKAARKGYCNPGTAIQVLTDLFDVLTLANCEILFKTVEKEVATWREPLFFTSGKNNLLRICNDLLRRLSRTQNTVFCGRILLFLAKFFPFSERSGLNVISEFNLDNVTNYSKEDQEPKPVVKEEIKEESSSKEDKKEKNEEDEVEIVMDIDEKNDITDKLNEKVKDKKEATKSKKVESKDEKRKLKPQKSESDDQNLNVDYSLYKKFWQIQDFFRNPVQCYQKDPWKTFSQHSSDVLAIFQSFKLDSSSSKSSSASAANQDQYFSKYLTNQNLLQLQLSDSNFRRYILLQFLILFQYLKSNVKFKSDNQTLSGDQDRWVGETTKKIYKLLEETPPNGPEFAKSVRHILRREDHWNKWKNEGCPSLAKKVDGNESIKNIGEGGSFRKKKRKLGDVIEKEVAEKRVNLGNPGLTSLWNLNPDNLDACRAKERDFLPSLENYFEEAIEQLDPKNGIEDTYKKVNNGEWGWRALRLMSRRSTHFFIAGNNPIARLPEYLETMLGKMAKEMPNAANKDDSVDDMEQGDNEAEGEENGGNAEDANTNPKVTESQLVDLSIKLADHWAKLVPKLGIADDKLEEIKTKYDRDDSKCLHLLNAWQEMEGDGATKDEIIYILEGLKLVDFIEGVF